MQEHGYSEGRDYVMHIRVADGINERLPPLAAELVRLPVDVLVANSTPAAEAAKQATRSIPIVTVAVADPVGSGLVQSLSRPGGNVTGTAWALDEVSYKWLELLKATRSDLLRVAVIYNSANSSMAAMLRPLETAAQALGLGLTAHDFTNAAASTSVFSALANDRTQGLVVLPDAFLFDQRHRIADAAARMRLPAIYGGWRYVEAGGLMSYGPDALESPSRAAAFVDKLLKGAKPADLPIERSRKFEMVVNLKAATAIGITIPQAVLLRADRIIQ